MWVLRYWPIASIGLCSMGVFWKLFIIPWVIMWNSQLKTHAILRKHSSELYSFLKPSEQNSHRLTLLNFLIAIQRYRLCTVYNLFVHLMDEKNWQPCSWNQTSLRSISPYKHLAAGRCNMDEKFLKQSLRILKDNWMMNTPKTVKASNKITSPGYALLNIFQI